MVRNFWRNFCIVFRKIFHIFSIESLLTQYSTFKEKKVQIILHESTTIVIADQTNELVAVLRSSLSCQHNNRSEIILRIRK